MLIKEPDHIEVWIRDEEIQSSTTKMHEITSIDNANIRSR